MKFGKLNYISGRFHIMNHLRHLHQGSHRGVLPIGGLWIIYSESNGCFGLSACQCQPLIYKAQCPKNMIGIEKRRRYSKKWDMSTGQSARPINQGSTGSQLTFEWEFPPYQMIGTGGTHNLCLVSCHGAVLILERLESTPWAQGLDTSYERRLFSRFCCRKVKVKLVSFVGLFGRCSTRFYHWFIEVWEVFTGFIYSRCFFPFLDFVLHAIHSLLGFCLGPHRRPDKWCMATNSCSSC